MCGIVGFLELGAARHSNDLEHTIRSMVATLRHRGPDSSGIWIDPNEQIALGHTRLSILDLSPSGQQPMISQNGRFIITYNGEVYNYRSLAENLAKCGVQFKGHSDTEVILEAVAHWGIETTLKQANGMFAFAIWDRKEKKLFISRDRLGKKPLYYGWQRGIFYFASELKALKAHPDFEPKINRDSLAAYFKYSYVPGPYSIYTGISKLSQGTIAKIDPHTQEVTTDCYWSVKETIDSNHERYRNISDDDAITQINASIRDSVTMRLVSDVPLGAFLSGGIDSSLVVSHMQAVSTQPAKTFTIGFKEKNYNEAPKAKAIAQHLGTDHTEYYVSADELTEYIPELAHTYDEPFSDISQLPSFVVCKLAKQAVTVCLSGDGGDEFFCGYNRYQSAIKKWNKLKKAPALLRETAATLISPFASASKSNDQLQRLYRLLKSQSAIDLFNLRNERLVNSNELVLESQHCHTAHSNYDLLSSQISPLEQMMQLDSQTWLVDDILVKMDRASMSHSLEIRNPLLDYKFASLALALPLHLKNRNGSSKWLLKECLKQYVPETLTNGPKRGFSVPLSHWLKGPLREWAEELLNPAKISQDAYLNPKIVQWLWINFLKGNNRYRSAIWSILMFQAWLNENNNSNFSHDLGYHIS